MRLEINRNTLAAAVAQVLPGVAKKELFSQANKLGIKGGQLVSYNDEISICHKLKEVAGIDAAIDGVHLYELLQRLTTENITLEPTESELIVRAARTRATLKMAPVALPLDEMEVGADTFPIDDEFRAKVKLVADICARDMSRPVLTCVHIASGWVQGSDSYRSARMQCDKDIPEILIPAAAAQHIMEYPVVSLSIGAQKHWMHCATADGTTISGRLIAGTYPNLRPIYRVEGTEFELPEALSEALDRAKVFAYRVHKIDEEVEVTLQKKNVIVRSQDDTGMFDERVAWGNEVVEAQFKINPDFLKLALQRGTKCVVDATRIKFSGDGWAHVIALR